MQRRSVAWIPALLALALLVPSCTRETGSGGRSHVPTPPAPSADDSLRANPEQTIATMTQQAETVATGFIQAIESGQPGQAYALTAPAYQRNISRESHDKLTAAWSETVGTPGRVTLVDRSIGEDEKHGALYVKLAYEVAGTKKQGVALFALVPLGGEWRVASLGLHWNGEPRQK